MNSFIVLSVVTIILSFMIALEFKNRVDKGRNHKWFVRLMLAVPIWTLFALLEVLISGSYDILLSQLSYIGVVSVPVLWLLFSLEYSKKIDSVSKRTILLLWIIPAITLLIAFTNNIHHLLWTNIYPYEKLDGYDLYKYERGIWYYVNEIYAYIMIFSGLSNIFLKLRKSKALKEYFVIIPGVLAPFVSNLLYLTRVSLLDYAPAAFSFSCFCFAWAVISGLFEREIAIANAVHKNMKEGIILIDEDFRIASINPYAREILYASDKATDSDAEKVIHFWDEMKPKLGSETNEYFEICIERDGISNYYSVHVYSITGESRIRGWIVSLFDITEKKHVEKKLEERSSAAEAANIAKSSFLASMSHEIRTPLNGIIGFVDILSQSALDEEQKDCLAEIQNASDILLYTINDILDFSKIEAERMEIEKVSFNLHNVIEDTVSLFMPKLLSSGVELHSEIHAGVPPTINGDPARLRQVLNNLVGNAVKFTREGEIILTAERIGEDDKAVTLRFAVSDTGIGISQEAQRRIFSPFTQADSSTTRKYGGTGLGLAICKRLIELMGGILQVESKENVGSRFTFAIKAGKEPCAEYSTVADTEGTSVVIIDSNNTRRRICRAYLGEFGLVVFDAGSIYDAEAMIAKTDVKPSIAVIDYDIFGKRIDAAEAGSADGNSGAETLKGMKVIIETSAAHRAIKNEMLKIKPSQYIIKPIRKKELLDAVIAAADPEAAPEEHKIISGHAGMPTIPVLSKNILLVEDIEANSKLVRIMFDKLGYRCDVAANGKEAVDICRERKFDLILMDCQMPIMDGYEATARIKAAGESNADTPVVAMTANALEGDREKCLAAGMDDFMTKPISMKKLGAVMEKWLN